MRSFVISFVATMGVVALLWVAKLTPKTPPSVLFTVDQAFPRAVRLMTESGCVTEQQPLLSLYAMNCALEFYEFDERVLFGEEVSRSFQLLESCLWCDAREH